MDWVNDYEYAIVDWVLDLTQATQYLLDELTILDGIDELGTAIYDGGYYTENL